MYQIKIVKEGDAYNLFIDGYAYLCDCSFCQACKIADEAITRIIEGRVQHGTQKYGDST